MGTALCWLGSSMNRSRGKRRRRAEKSVARCGNNVLRCRLKMSQAKLRTHELWVSELNSALQSFFSVNLLVTEFWFWVLGPGTWHPTVMEIWSPAVLGPGTNILGPDGYCDLGPGGSPGARASKISATAHYGVLCLSSDSQSDPQWLGIQLGGSIIPRLTSS